MLHPKNVLGLVVILFLYVGLSGCAAPPTPTPVPPTPTPAPTASGKVILTTGDWPPYVFETGGDPGPIPALVVAAFKEVGITPEIVFYPWKRAENEARQGNAFAAFPYARSAERQQEFDFSDPMYVVKGKFFYHKKYHPNGMPFEKLEDLRGYTIGGMLGSWYEGLFKETGLQTEYATMEQNLHKLALGRIDLTVEEENTTWYLIRQLYPDEVDQFGTLAKPLEQPGFVNDLNLMVSRNYPNSAELLAKFNTGLKAIRDKGIYKQILEKYHIVVQ